MYISLDIFPNFFTGPEKSGSCITNKILNGDGTSKELECDTGLQKQGHQTGPMFTMNCLGPCAEGNSQADKVRAGNC